jgi:hypothetical protein
LWNDERRWDAYVEVKDGGGHDLSVTKLPRVDGIDHCPSVPQLDTAAHAVPAQPRRELINLVLLYVTSAKSEQ